MFMAMSGSALAAYGAVKAQDRSAFIGLAAVARIAELAVAAAAITTFGTGVGLVIMTRHSFGEAWLVATYVLAVVMAILPHVLANEPHRTALHEAKKTADPGVPDSARAPLLTPTYRAYRPLMFLLAGTTLGLMVFRPG